MFVNKVLGSWCADTDLVNMLFSLPVRKKYQKLHSLGISKNLHEFCHRAFCHNIVKRDLGHLDILRISHQSIKLVTSC